MLSSADSLFLNRGTTDGSRTIDRVMPDTPTESATPPATRPDHHGLGVHHPDEPPKKLPAKRGMPRRLFRVGMLLLALVLVLFVLTPMLLSTGLGTKMLASFISTRLDGQVEIEDLRLSWLKGQRAEGVRYTDAPAGFTAEIGVVRADDVGLFGLLTGSRRFGEVRAIDMQVTYDQPDERPLPESGREQRDPQEDKPFSLSRGWSGSIVIENLRVDYTARDQQPVVILMPSGTLEMPGLSELAFDFDASLKQGQRSGQIKVAGEVNNLFGPDGVIQPMLADYQAEAHVDGIPTVALGRLLSGMRYTGGMDFILGRPGRLAAVLGEGDLDAQAKIDGTVSELSTTVIIQTPNLYLYLDQEREGDTLLASERSSAWLDLTEQSLSALFPNSRHTLVEKTRINLSTIKMRLPRDGNQFDWKAASTHIEAKTSDNFALRDEAGEVLGIDALRLVGGAQSIEKQLAFELSAALTSVDDQGQVKTQPVQARLEIDRPMAKDREVLFTSPALPIALADALWNMDDKLVLYVGETLGLQAEMRSKSKLGADGNRVTVQSYRLWPRGQITGEVTGEFVSNRYTFATPDKTPIEAVLQPEAFANLMEMLSGRTGEPALTIDRPMPVFITLREADRGLVSIATDPSKRGIKRFYPDLDNTFVGIEIELTPATVYDPIRKATYELRSGMLSLTAKDLRGEADISADLQFWVPPSAGEEGVSAVLTYQTTLSNLLDSQGGIPLDGPSFMKQIALSGGVQLDNTPSGLFDSLLNQQGDIASILGPVVEQLDASFTYADGQATGATVTLNWDEKNNRPLPGAWASMKPAKFDIDQNQVMTVRGGGDLEVQVKVSEDFGDRWMGQLHPILFDAKSGDRPVNIKIDGGSFSFPLNDPSMQGARVDAEIDLGSVQFGENALLGKLLEWTDHQGERAIFEPAKVSLIDGKVSYDEFDLAVGNVRLRLDGTVDLVDGEIVDMAVRVPGDSLIRVFNELEGVIPADDYLSIPMSGPIRKPKVEPRALTQEVTRLLTQGVFKRQRDNLKQKVLDELDLEEGKPGEEFIDNAFDLIFGQRGRKIDPEGDE